jgi:hypothetical protein
MPEPTIDPTTIAVSANNESFWVDGVAIMEAPRDQQRLGWSAVFRVSTMHFRGSREYRVIA